MTLGQESSDRGPATAQYAEVEFLAGVFHRHAIEAQEFSYYSLVIDVRSRAEYEDDHTPETVQGEPPRSVGGSPGTRAEDRMKNAVGSTWGNSAAHDIPAALTEVVNLGRGIAMARLDRRRVARRLDQLPPLGAGRSGGATSTRDVPGHRLLIGNRSHSRAVRLVVGHQVLDVEEVTGWRKGAMGVPLAPQPAEARFESQLMQAIRGFDPRSPV